MLTQEIFLLRLAETINWCNSRINLPTANNPIKALRSPELDPGLAGQHGDMNLTTKEQWTPVAEGLVEKRAQLLRAAGNYPTDSVEIAKAAKGVIMVYFPYLNVRDGPEEAGSAGFFDYDGVPPWDTWITLTTDPESAHPWDELQLLLLCYIPEPFVKVAGAGMWGSTLGCINWIGSPDVKKTAFIQEILQWIALVS